MIDPADLYNLRPEEFESLCADLLRANGFQEVSLVGGPKDMGVDLIARKDGFRYLVEVKHRKRLLHRREIQEIVDRIQRSGLQADGVILMTSSPIDDSAVNEVNTSLKFEILARDEISQLLESHQKLKEEKLLSARRRRYDQIKRTSLSGIAAVISAIALNTSIFQKDSDPSDLPLENRIQTVDNALEGIKGLEEHLKQIKLDMESTAEETQQIQEEYRQAMALKDLTEEQIAITRKALASETLGQKALTTLLGFVLGVASSVVGSVVYSKIKQFRALTK